MSKKSALERSNAAHRRLLTNKDGSSRGWKAGYHSTCISKQNHYGRVLTRSERKSIFDNFKKR